MPQSRHVAGLIRALPDIVAAATELSEALVLGTLPRCPEAARRTTGRHRSWADPDAAVMMPGQAKRGERRRA
jgi:hypothetical protein